MYYSTIVTHSTEGVKTRDIGFQATHYKITVGPKVGGSNSVILSEGTFDGTNQICRQSYSDGSRARQDPWHTDRMVCVKDWDGTAISTQVIAVHHSITPTQVKYEVTKANQDYPFKFEAWDEPTV